MKLIKIELYNMYKTLSPKEKKNKYLMKKKKYRNLSDK